MGTHRETEARGKRRARTRWEGWSWDGERGRGMWEDGEEWGGPWRERVWGDSPPGAACSAGRTFLRAGGPSWRGCGQVRLDGRFPSAVRGGRVGRRREGGVCVGAGRDGAGRDGDPGPGMLRLEGESDAELWLLAPPSSLSHNVCLMTTFGFGHPRCAHAAAPQPCLCLSFPFCTQDQPLPSTSKSCTGCSAPSCKR